MNHNLDKMQLPKDTTSFVNYLTQSVISRTRSCFDDALKNELTKELKALGFTFQDDYEFNDFCIKHIERRLFSDKPYYNELHLKIGLLEKQLFAYSDKIDIDYSELNHFKITGTIFRKIN